MPREAFRYDFTTVAYCDMCHGTSFKLLGIRLSTSQGFTPRLAEGIGVPVKRCRACGLIFSDPQPAPEELADHYGVPPEEYWQSAEFKWSPDYLSTEILTTKRLLPFVPGMRALDIGAGLGKAMKSFTAAGFDTWGIEPSAEFRERAISWMGIDSGRLQLATAEQAHFPNAYFDFISCGAVLEHLKSPSLVLERALQWLKPGGIIHANVPSSRWLVSKIVNSWFRLAGTNYVTHLSPMHSPFHLFEFGLRSFELNGERLGYSVAEHEVMTCTVMHLPFKPLFRRIMDATGTGMQLLVYLRRPHQSGACSDAD
jgi:SAM-dependent methyltransferase